MLHLTFPPNPKPNIGLPWGRPGLHGITRGNRFNPIKTEQYNMQNKDTIDFSKTDVVKPTPK